MLGRRPAHPEGATHLLTPAHVERRCSRLVPAPTGGAGRTLRSRAPSSWKRQLRRAAAAAAVSPLAAVSKLPAHVQQRE